MINIQKENNQIIIRQKDNKIMSEIPPMPDVISRKYFSPTRRPPTEGDDEDVPFLPNMTSLSTLSLESKFEKMGVEIKGKIIIEEKEKLIVRYVRICLADGTSCYVDLDVEGYISHEDDIVTLREYENNHIPYSKKTGDLYLVNPDAEGVIFEGAQGIVVIYKDEKEQTPVEKSYSFDSNETENYKGYFEDTVSSYPLIKMSQFNINPKTTIENGSLAYSRLLSKEIKETTKDINLTYSSIKKFYYSFSSLKTNFDKLSVGFLSDISKLESGYEIKCKNPNNRCLEDICYNLKTRKEFLKTLVHIVTRIGTIEEKINNMKDEVNGMNEYIEKYVRWIDKDCTPIKSELNRSLTPK